MKFLLKGDVSGIQEFIFNVQSDGAAKSLKAKSFYIDLLSRLCYSYCINQLKQPEIVVDEIYCGGGNFFLELESFDDVSGRIERIQTNINKELLHDEIAVVLTLLPRDGQNFGEDWICLLKKSNLNKLTKHKGNYELFEPYFHEEKENINNKKRFEKYNQKYKDNLLFSEITTRLVKSKLIEAELYDEAIRLVEGNFIGKLTDKLPLWNNYDELEKYKSYRSQNYSVDNQIKNEENLIDFDGFGDFAGKRTGTNRLGILKMDVDNLGSIFKDKVRSKEDAKALSAEFVEFFEKELYRIWADEKFRPDIYPVFAGGDDCFLIGSWDKVLLFTKSIRDAFKITFEDKWTLSAGIVFVHPKHSVSSFANLVNDALDKAKREQTFDEVIKKIKHQKNSICLFDEVFTWDELDKIIQLSNEISGFVHSGKVKRSFIDKIRNSAKGFSALQQDILKRKRIDVPKLWRLQYYIGRKQGARGFENVLKSFIQPYEEALQKNLFKQEATNPAIFPIAARIIEMYTKEKIMYDTNND